MNKYQDSDRETAPAKVDSSKKTSRPFGKIFLLAGIVLVQAVAAYTIVKAYYPEMYEMIAKQQSPEGVYYSLENIVVNPAETNGHRYIILSMTIKLSNIEALKKLKNNTAKVKDRANKVISKHTVEELSSVNKRETIKKELGIVINKVIGKNSVRNLFFTKYVLQ